MAPASRRSDNRCRFCDTLQEILVPLASGCTNANPGVVPLDSYYDSGSSRTYTKCCSNPCLVTRRNFAVGESEQQLIQIAKIAAVTPVWDILCMYIPARAQNRNRPFRVLVGRMSWKGRSSLESCDLSTDTVVCPREISRDYRAPGPTIVAAW